MTSASPSKRELTKAANRAAILVAAREVFAELGFEAATVRDVIRRTDLASGTFYNYFPDKESLLRALVEEAATEIARAFHEAHVKARTGEALVADGFRAYFEFLVADPQLFAIMRRNAGALRAMFDAPAVGLSLETLTADLQDGIDRGLLPPHDVEMMARAMTGAGFEVAVLMLEREPVDVEGAVSFISEVFLRGLQGRVP